jgi:hypothetical protein
VDGKVFGRRKLILALSQVFYPIHVGIRYNISPWQAALALMQARTFTETFL